MRNVAISLIAVLWTGAALADGAGIKFDEMKVGTKLITQSLSGDEEIKTQEYIGVEDDLHLMRVTWDKVREGYVNELIQAYDSKGRLVQTRRDGDVNFYEPFDCRYAVGHCEDVYDYYNPFSKNEGKRTRTHSQYKNRLTDDKIAIGYVKYDGEVRVTNWYLGKYNLRTSSRSRNAFDELQGFKLIDIVEP